jgi:hypothetical protein
MKQPEYIEEPKALENFKQGMKALFKVPKKCCEYARIGADRGPRSGRLTLPLGQHK